MSKQKVSGTLDSVASMLMYHYQALVEDGCLDPKKEMATVLPKLINLSEAQSNYVMSEIGDNPVRVMLENVQLIVRSMKLDADKEMLIKASDLTVLENSLKEINKILGGDSYGTK